MNIKTVIISFFSKNENTEKMIIIIFDHTIPILVFVDLTEDIFADLLSVSISLLGRTMGGLYRLKQSLQNNDGTISDENMKNII